MSELLSVLKKTSLLKAQIISTRLETAGIECYFKYVNQTPESIPTEINVYVKEADLEKAQKLLSELQIEIANEKVHKTENIIFPDLFIIPVDFSSASYHACIYGIQLAAVLKARLKIIHTYGLPEVRPISFDDTDFYTGTLTQHITDLRQDAEKRMAELITNLNTYISEKKIGEIPISTTIVNGLPDEISLFSAESEKAGLIILGISGREARNFEPMGKIASRIVGKAKVPVLTIPEDSSFKGPADVLNILYITTFDESDFSAIQKLFKITEKLNSHIFFLHISNQEIDNWDTIRLEGLKEYFSKTYNNINVSYELMVSDNILEALDNFITRNKIDIISNITRKQNLISKLIHPDITFKILYHTQLPYLVFHH